MYKNVMFLTILWILYLLPCNLYANTPIENHTFNITAHADEIKEFIQTKFAEQYEGEIVAELLQKDFSFQPKQCSMPLNYSMPEHTVLGSHTTVKISCNGENTWSIYLPVSIKIYQPVVTTNRPMSRDEIISADVVNLKNIDTTNLNQGFFSDPIMVIGHAMRFPVKAGNVLTPGSIAKNKLVKRGDRVNIAIEDPELIVFMQGESLEDGGLGDNIKVRNISSKRIVEATIIAPGKVQVHM